jgi:hypothetical protein
VRGAGSEAGSGFPLLLIAGSGTCVTAARALSAAAAARWWLEVGKREMDVDVEVAGALRVAFLDLEIATDDT